MSSVAARLLVRLVAIQFLVGLSVALIVVTFAPRLLLLDTPAVVSTAPLVFWAGAAMAVFSAIMTVLITRRLRPALRALSNGSSEVPPEDVLAIYGLPLRIALIDVAGAVVVSAATLFAPLRPATNDLYTQAALILLTLTITSAATLPMYVMMRAAVAKVLELAPVVASREALRMMDLRHRRFAHVRQRLVAAVAAPVAFVALGASLLVHAHVRAFDSSAREADARALASATLGELDGDATGRADAIAAAAAHGYRIAVERSPALLGVLHDDEGETRLTVPLDGGHALVRFDTTGLSPVTWIYILLAAVATMLAALLGSRFGQLFVADVLLATRAVRETGAEDVVRGTRVRREARFAQISALMDAIDSLGTVFREFASAQERAIDARAATERMRGLFLASMSHDLKGPLNAILGFAELVSRSPLSEPQRESLTIVEQRGRELLTLIQTILDSARVEAGELNVSPDWTMLGDVVMAAVLDARDLAAGTGVEVVGEVQPGVPKVYIDASRINQALTAVIASAARFTDKGVVNVRATVPAQSDRLRIDVESSGRAVPSAELEKIFEAFKDSDRARQHGSLGLGLSLARSIFELHAGSIEVAATEAGGTAFKVWLPLSGERVKARMGR